MKVDFYNDYAKTASYLAKTTVVDYDAGLKRMRVCSPRKDFASVLSGVSYIASNTLHSIANTYVWANTTSGVKCSQTWNESGFRRDFVHGEQKYCVS